MSVSGRGSIGSAGLRQSMGEDCVQEIEDDEVDTHFAADEMKDDSSDEGGKVESECAQAYRSNHRQR